MRSGSVQQRIGSSVRSVCSWLRHQYADRLRRHQLHCVRGGSVQQRIGKQRIGSGVRRRRISDLEPRPASRAVPFIDNVAILRDGHVCDTPSSAWVVDLADKITPWVAQVVLVVDDHVVFGLLVVQSQVV